MQFNIGITTGQMFKTRSWFQKHTQASNLKISSFSIRIFKAPSGVRHILGAFAETP
jgi:hypothetical protein